jgi:hypothetical protein
MGDIAEKRLSNSLGSIESITDYRQRTGKSKEEMGVEDYVFLIDAALRATGFDVSSIVTTCVHTRDITKGNMTDLCKKHRLPFKFEFAVGVRPAETGDGNTET